MKKCIICQESNDEPQNPLHEESPLRPEDHVHSMCLSGPAYSKWVEEQRALDREYARYWDMLTYGLPCACPECGLSLNLAPKAVGMGADNWELCCSECPQELPNGISGYAHPEIYSRLEALREKFLIGRDLMGLKKELLALSVECEVLLENRSCDCGGYFSVAAPPRCPQCSSVAIDSCFHTLYISDE